MMIVNLRINQFVFFSILTILLLITGIMDAEARRRYNPERTRQQAIQIIKTSSETVSELAGLEPELNDSVKLVIDDSEILDENGELGEDLAELEKEDDVAVDLEMFKTLWLEYVDDSEDDEYTENGISKRELMTEIMDWLGTPYRFGGTSTRAIDCSAFTQKVFLNVCEILIPRTARAQVHVGEKIAREDLQFGDLIFFHTYSRRFASHVGIYLGDDLFAHASSRWGVTVSSLESTYYRRRFIGGRRFGVRDLINFSITNESKMVKQ